MPHPRPERRGHAPPGIERLLAGLTPEQARPVQHGSGPLLLIAGSGAGKTKTLTHRTAYLLSSGRARPEEILAVTFSVRAAGKLRLRLADLLGEQIAREVTTATFHSVCARLLRDHASVLGRTGRYTIYDQADMRRVIDWLLSDAQRGHIRQAIADAGQPASVRGARPDLARQEPAAVRLLGEQPHRLQWLRQRWRWILVDEFQEVSVSTTVVTVSAHRFVYQV